MGRLCTDFIHSLAAGLKTVGCKEVRYALVDSDPQLADKPSNERARLCYLWDRELLERSDLIVAEASFPSIGLGIELQLAESKGTPIVLCYRRSESARLAPVDYENPDHTRHSLQIGEGFVSLMALGLPSLFRCIGYEDSEAGIRKIVEAVELFQRSPERGHLDLKA